MDPVLITVRESQGFITGSPPEAAEELVKATSFRPEGFQYTMAYKKGRGDGRIKLLKHSKFPAGLLGRVIQVYRDQEIPFTVQHERSEIVKPDLALALTGIQDREYQDRAVEAAVLYPRGVIRVPTGGGKTAIGARIIVMKGKWALVVVPTIDLLYQYKRFLEEHIFWDTPGDPPLAVGQLGDGVVDPQPITVATVRTAAAALGLAYEKGHEFVVEANDKDDTKVRPHQLKAWIEKIDTLLVDEAHILGAQTVYDVATKLPATNKYGFSASPWRDDGADLMIEAGTGHQIFRIPTKALVDDGWLVPPVIRVIETKDWWKPQAWGSTCPSCGAGRTRDADTGKWSENCVSCGRQKVAWRSEFTQAYTHEIVDNAIRNWHISEIVKKLDGPTLLLVKQVKHGRAFQGLLPGSVFLSGKDSGTDRQNVFDAVRCGMLDVVIATTIADLGLDVPPLRNLVLAGGGKSSTRHLQRIGRIARPYEGKTHALVIDFDDGHVHRWFREQARARRKIEKAEWGECALWI